MCFRVYSFTDYYMYFNADFAMQTSSEYTKYDIEEYYCPTSSISMRKVHVNMIVIENCYSRSLKQFRAPLLVLVITPLVRQKIVKRF